MAAQNDKVSQAVKETMEYIQKNDPEVYSKLCADSKVKDAVNEAARAAAAEQLKLASEFSSQNYQDIRNRLNKHLPEDRIKMIEEALTIPTFRMDITQNKDGKHQAALKRGDEEFLSSMVLATTANTDRASKLQYASIVIEAVMLVLQAVGIKAEVSSSTMKTVVEDTAKAIEKSSVMQRAIKAFTTAWEEAGGSNVAKAKAIFNLLKETKGAGLLWTIIKSLCKEMKWYDWLKTSATVTAMIIAAVASDGVALIAKIALAVLAAVDFARKIANVVKLKEIKQTL